MSNLSVTSSPKATSPTRRHQIKRSLSELASPGKSSRHSHRKDRERAHDERGLRHALTASDARRSLDTPRRDGPSPMLSPESSRRPSLLMPTLETSRTGSKERRDERLRQERDRIAGNAENLTQSLAELNDFATGASRRLDDAYYAVLEKMSMLHNTVAALKDLAETSQGVYESFERDSRRLENEFATQVGAMGHFQTQQSKIMSLQSRIHDGRGKMKALTDRVDTVRHRIEQWEQADKQWQEKTRKRLKIIWSAMSVLVVLLIILLWSVSNASSGRGGISKVATDELGRTISILEPLNTSNHVQPPGDDEEPVKVKLLWKTPMHDDDDQLRAFDEL